MLFPLSPRVTFCLALPLTAALAACAPSNADPAPAGERVATSAQPLAAGLPLVSRAAAALAGSPAFAAGRDAGPKSGDELFALARGRWVGHCDILVPGRDEPVDTVEMERITESTDDPNAFSWTIIYRAPGLEQVRPYTMRVDPQTPGRYLLDENNGIVLTSYLLDGGLLVSEFEVQGLRLTTREAFRGPKYDFEIVVSSTSPELSSDVGEGLVVDAFRVSSVQKCSLKRQGPPR